MKMFIPFQLYLNYHCCICNVIITRKDLKSHIEWPTHSMQNENTMKNIKKTRKTDVKGGVKDISVFTQKENIFLNDKEPTVQILQNCQSSNGNTNITAKTTSDVNDSVQKTAETGCRKNKIVFFLDNVLKISWDSWHGITNTKSGFRYIFAILFKLVDE